MMNKHDTAYTQKTKRYSLEVKVGDITIGGGCPVVVQTMANTDTMDTEASVNQAKRVYDAGCRLLRYTTQGLKEAENMGVIKQRLKESGLSDLALVADIHFRPDVAIAAAAVADKVRINPGNYNDPDGTKLRELVSVCKENNTAIRIGVNHGSLSKDIVEEFGDTPEGMVESAMVFLRKCRNLEFDQVVVSMKSSNVRVMVQAYRMLCAAMADEDMRYPLHLGVTEAGDGLDGRIKSAVGIGTLLTEGIGDTIRVSLTEDPEHEIPVARLITSYIENKPYATGTDNLFSDVTKSTDYARRSSNKQGNLGAGQIPVLFDELDHDAKTALASGEVVVLTCDEYTSAATLRDKIKKMDNIGDHRPVIIKLRYSETVPEVLAVKAACDAGMVFLDGLADGLWIENNPKREIPEETLRDIALLILQAARVRISKTEYIACPGCGRTLFDLQHTLQMVKARTSHLKGLKIGVMGCIVNGPGEMADADYGYVGAGPGKVSLYKGKEVIKKSVPQEIAITELIEIIKAHGDWRDPEVETQIQ